MAFVNEKIPEADKPKIAEMVSKLSSQLNYTPNFDFPRTSRWTIDRESGIYLIYLTGGRERFDDYALVLEDLPVVFCVEMKSNGNDIIGLQENWIIHNLRIPIYLESQKEKIKQLISESLEEIAHFRPFANGGTRDNPNTKARGNIISFKVEFK